MMLGALGAPILGAAVYMWMKNRRPHQKVPAYTRKLKAKLRAQYRRKLRSSKTSPGERRMYRQLLSLHRRKP